MVEYPVFFAGLFAGESELMGQSVGRRYNFPTKVHGQVVTSAGEKDQCSEFRRIVQLTSISTFRSVRPSLDCSSRRTDLG